MAAAGMKMPAVLFCCTHNRCRSRMAEAVARHLLPGWTFMSAGSAPAGGIDPGAEAALRESGLEASGPARRVQDLDLSAFDLIVTLCSGGKLPVASARSLEACSARSLRRSVPSRRRHAAKRPQRGLQASHDRTRRLLPHASRHAREDSCGRGYASFVKKSERPFVLP